MLVAQMVIMDERISIILSVDNLIIKVVIFKVNYSSFLIVIETKMGGCRRILNIL